MGTGMAGEEEEEGARKRATRRLNTEREQLE
jgi:hypothetical protein